jgi:hypothetical protein
VIIIKYGSTVVNNDTHVITLVFFFIFYSPSASIAFYRHTRYFVALCEEAKSSSRQFAMGAVLASFLPIDLHTESELLYCKLPLDFLLSSSFFAMKVLSGLSEQRKSLTEIR